MPRRPLLALCAIALVAGTARAQEAPTPEPPEPVVPDAPEPVPVPVPVPLPVPDLAPPPPPPVGLTAAEIRARPRLSREERAAMRARCEERAPDCDPIALLGNLERAALVRALDGRGLVVEPAPAGKIVRRVHVVTNPVFGDDERIFRWANFFHVASKERVVAREVLIRPGDGYDLDKVDETLRKLRDPLFTSLAVIVPVVAAGGGPNDVDVLVVTRDIWSLRMNSNYEFQGGQFTYLALSLSENNFFGRRMLVALSFVMDQATISVGPLYIDKNFLGQRLDVRGRGGPLFNRETFELEGSSSSLAVSRPLWSLDSEWSWGVDWSHKYAIERAFRDTELRTYDAPSTPEDDMIPYEYRQDYWSAGIYGVRQLGGPRLKHRIKAGYDLTSQRPRLLDSFMGADAARADFIANVLPRDERTGIVYAAYEIFTPRYREYRDIDGFDLAESTRLGPYASILAGAGLRALASDVNFGRLSAEAGWTAPLGRDGVASLAASFSTRYEGRAFVDRVAATSLRVVTPSTPLGRAVTSLRLAGVYRDESNRFLYLGGDSGLRAYPINFLDGDRRVVAQTELRSRSVRWFLGSRWGVLLFHDVGGAADRADDVRLYQDVGIGIRALGAQLSSEVFRFDVAFPLSTYDVGGGSRAAWSPRFSAGYRQAF